MSSYRDQPQYHSSSEEEETKKPRNQETSSSDGETQGFLCVLSSQTTDYLVQSYLGEGTFGKVAKCLKTATNETVAVKIIKHMDYTPEAQNEVKILQQLRGFDGDRYNFVKFYDTFVDSGKICLEFEMLDMNLWDYLEKRPGFTLTVKEIRPILYQMGITLQLLKSQGLVHSDLKPDNIMLVDQHHQPMKIKIIDFGLACDVSQLQCGTYMQARYYRAPEVILGSPPTTAIDMWSLGCIAAELFLGFALYPGGSEYDMLRRMVQTQGHFPQKALDNGLKTQDFFNKRRKGQRWRLKSSCEYGYSNYSDTQFNSLDDLKEIRPVYHLSGEDTMAEDEDRDDFVELLKQMLHLDVNKRITPSQLLDDPFITMTDLTDSFPDSFYVKSSCEIMKVCQDSEVESKQQPSTSSATPAWRNYKEHPAIVTITSDMSSSLSCSDSPQQEQLSLTFHGETSPETPMIVEEAPSCSHGVGQGWRDKSLEKKKRMKMNQKTKTRKDSLQNCNQLLTSSADAPSLKKDTKKTTREVTTSTRVIQTRLQKRKNDILDKEGRKSPNNKPEQRRKRTNKSREKDKATSETPEKPEDNPIKPQRKRKRVTSVSEDRLKESDTRSPERKRMRLEYDLKEISPTEAERKPQRKRKWETFVAAHRELREFQSDSPERKKRKMNPEEEETEKKTSDDSTRGLTGTKPSGHAMTLRKRKTSDKDL